MRQPILILLFLLSGVSYSAEKKQVGVNRVTESPTIDGDLNEAFWMECQISSDFIQHTPEAGKPSIRGTQVRMAYDNEAIYIGATMFDERDSMSLTLSQRDNLGNADWFGVIFDPYNAGTIGFAFLVTSAGVQVDELHQVDDIDANWNAVWQSAVTVLNDRWNAEIKIPFSALRFPKNPQNNWGINFARNIRRKREESFWNYYDPAGLNLISQLGQVSGIKDIDTPVRLSVTPYVSGYIENYNGTTGYTANGGMDLKYGVNDAFTIDMTLIPDFGQVQFDNQVLNLSPFEVQYNERRQFFTEGTELYNKWWLFYSRRIGGRPFDYWAPYSQLDSNEVVSSNPESSQLINATKFSGRTTKGTGIGVFNAVTGRMDAIIEDTLTGVQRSVRTNPLTNYNVFVLDQNMKNNSSVTLTNMNTWREGYAYDANVTNLGFDLYTSGQKFNFWGATTVSQLYEQSSTDLGYKAVGGIEKSSGNLQGGLVYEEISDTYDPNDLGFQTVTNVRTGRAFVNYNIYEPFWKLYRMWSGLSVYNVRIIDPNAFSNFGINLNVGGTFRNFMTAGCWLYGEPLRSHDYFEPRTPGRFYEGDQSIAAGGFISSDYSKPFAIDIRGGSAIFNDEQRWGADLELSPRFRFSDRYFMVYTLYGEIGQNEEGAALTYDFDLPFDGDNPVFAKRDRLTIINTIDASYIFNNRMGITFRLRHYWSKVEYNSFFQLADDGTFSTTIYTGFDVNDESLHDNSFNAFTIDMAYRWVFAPGSELSLVWKNSIFNFSGDVALNYFENVGAMVGLPATNSISLKVLFYLDYWTVKQNLKNTQNGV